MQLFHTEWRNDSVAHWFSPGPVQQVAGLSPALGTRFFEFAAFVERAAMRVRVCRASECQVAVVLAIPAVDSPRARSHARRVTNRTPSTNGCAQLRTKQPTGLPNCFLLACDVLHAAIVFFCLQSGQPRVTTRW